MDPLDIRRTRPAETNTKSPLRETASQTAGPYVHIGCLPNTVGVKGIFPNDLTSNYTATTGDTIVISGQVFEGEGIVCKDIMLEFWQTDQTGNYTNGLWHRASTDSQTGLYTFETKMPGSFTDADGNSQAPFINVWVTARGINIGLLTRIYFANSLDKHPDDPHMKLIAESRHATLLARQTDDANNYQFDIHLQGEQETVFFDV